MKKRIVIQDVEPNAYKAMFGLEKYLSTSTLDKILLDLIKIRASQINGCAYCIDIHTVEAMKIGETQRRIFALSAWWESPLFTDKEKIVLKMTEEVTMITTKGLSTETYQEAEKYFNENEIAQLIIQIGTINLWNRIAVSTRLMHEK